ncbi:unnamed protein product [Cuscuta europaea]|uniref:Late embryogenesis abundant protein LEA-2 subgroup domain-containing protein n=1 Tax=Cuscuta europaea TaxID=41803 RepID=A0A9P0Z7G2_CUSEU|nr:unnamed protein product [Cuscuta europaea]
MTSSESFSFFSPEEHSSPRLMLPPPPPGIKLPPSFKQTPSPGNRLQTPYKNNKVSKKPADEYPIIRIKSCNRTNPLVWCLAIFCLIFSLLLIFSGVVTLVIFLSIKPRTPVFDTPAGTLNFVYINSLQFLNGEISFLANFTNPNRSLNVRYESLEIELYFYDSLIATQFIEPFSGGKGEVKMVQVNLISSLVYLPPNHALGLQRQVMNNRVVFNIKAVFKVRVNMGPVHYSYWLHGRCQVEMTGPPNGFLTAHKCITKR